MIDEYIEIIKAILPPIITGLMGFWLAKQKNDNLDNIKIAYNRVYFPIYQYISLNSNITIKQLIKYSKKYIEKYFKYVDKSTLNCFKKLEEENNDKTLNEFKNNIIHINSYLRRKLNYLESNSLSIYSFSTIDQKILCVIISTSFSYGFLFASEQINNVIVSFTFITMAFIFIIASIIMMFQLIKRIF